MNTFQKAGGLAAFAHAFAYLVGIILAVTLIFPVLNGNPNGYFEYVRDNAVLMHIWILITYWGSAVSVVFMALALYHRLNTRVPLMVQAATVFGLIWAGLIIASANLMLNDFRMISSLYTADPSLTSTAWTILEAVENGIISGNELVGSLWVSMVSLAALRQNGLARPLATLGGTLGVVGLVTLVFPEACLVFGLGMVIWSIWLGVELLQTKVEVVA